MSGGNIEICKFCGEPFEKIHSMNIFCSIYCQKQKARERVIKQRREATARKLATPVACLYCKKEFLRNTLAQKFCSPDCYPSNQEEKRNCKHCGKIFVSARGLKRKYCSKACASAATLKKRAKTVGKGPSAKDLLNILLPQTIIPGSPECALAVEVIVAGAVDLMKYKDSGKLGMETREWIEGKDFVWWCHISGLSPNWTRKMISDWCAKKGKTVKLKMGSD